MGCYNTCVVPASVEHVWDALRDFHNLSWAKGVVEKVAVVGECASDQIGAKRVINDVFHETLLALDDEARSLKYSIDSMSWIRRSASRLGIDQLRFDAPPE
jgi:hypothetical protein